MLVGVMKSLPGSRKVASKRPSPKLSVLRFDLQECSATYQSLQWPEGYAIKTTQEVARELSKDVEASHEVVFVDTVSWVLRRRR